MLSFKLRMLGKAFLQFIMGTKKIGNPQDSEWICVTGLCWVLWQFPFA